jgi:hypothetical protein
VALRKLEESSTFFQKFSKKKWRLCVVYAIKVDVMDGPFDGGKVVPVSGVMKLVMCGITKTNQCIGIVDHWSSNC